MLKLIKKQIAFFVLLTIILFANCKKFKTINDEDLKQFTVSEAKEWWYGVFKKSAAYNELDPSSEMAAYAKVKKAIQEQLMIMLY